MVEESAEIKEALPDEATFHTKGFVRGELISNILITVVVSMSLMMLLTILGVPIIIVAGFLLISMYLILRFLSGYTRYTVNKEGLERYIRPHFKQMAERTDVYTWNDIRSYQRGDDLNRSRERFQYLYISVRKAPGRIRITDDKGDKQAFNLFANVFETYVEQPERQTADTIPPDTPELTMEEAAHKAMVERGEVENSIDNSRPKSHIKKERTFYQTMFAKVLTIAFIVLSGFLVNYGIQNGMRPFNSFRLGVIIIPGTIYMIYRVFYRKG